MTLTGTLNGPTISLGKTASSSTFTQLASGQYYTLTVTVVGGPATAALSILDSLPAGVTTSGAVTIGSANSGKLSGCPGAGSTNLTGCTVASGAVTPIVITVPVNVSLSTASSVTNTASVSGGGDAACTGSGACQSNVTTSVVPPPSPTIVINKTLGGSRVNSADQFTVKILEAGNVVNATTNSTTTGAGSTVSAGTGTTGTYKAKGSTSYTLTEAGASGANLAQYSSTLSCTDSTGLQTGLPTNAAFSASTGYPLTPIAGAQISCTITNTAKSSALSLNKALGTTGRVNAADQFALALKTGGVTGTASASVTTTGSGTTATGTAALNPAVTGTAYTLTEAGSGSTNLAQYSSKLTCTDSAGVQTGLPSNAAFSASTGYTLTPVAGAQISCSITNSAALVKLTIKKITTVGKGTFTFNGTPANANGFSTDGSYGVTTTTAGTAASGSTVNLVVGNTVTEVQETVPAGWLLSNASCMDNNASATGNPASFGTLSGATLQIPATNARVGSDVVCTFTNVPAPTMAVTQKAIVTAPATFNPPVTFGYTGNNGWAFQQNSSTVVNTVTKGLTQALTALNVATTLTVAVPTSETGWKIASMRCTDTNAAVSGNPLPPAFLASSTSNTVTVPAIYVVANAALQCAVIASRLQ